MAGGGGQQGAAAPAQGQTGQGAGQPQGGGTPQQQQPQVNPQTIQDIQNMIQQYQSGQLGGAQRGFAIGGPTNMGAPTPPAAGPNIYGGGVNPNMNQTFAPQSPMGAFPQQPQGGGPDMTGYSPAANMGYDGSGSDAGIGGHPVQGVQSPLSKMQKPGGPNIYGGGVNPNMSKPINMGAPTNMGGPYGGINPQATRPMPVGNKPLSLPQIRPQQRGLQIAGNPNAQPVMRNMGPMR